jgi:hypothetical protein
LPTPIDGDHELRPHVAPNADLRDDSFATGQATRLSFTTGRCIRPPMRSKLSSSSLESLADNRNPLSFRNP